jgi:hypothetical protein
MFGYWSELGEAAVEELLRHKIMPRHVTPPGTVEQETSRLRQRDLIARYGLSLTDIGLWSGADRNTCWMKRAPSVPEILSAVDLHEPDLNLINYTADEIDRCPHLNASIKEWARNMHAAGVRNLLVMAPTPDLFDDGSGSGRSAADIWVVLPKVFENSSPLIAAALNKGDEVWSYNALVQDGYSPKWLIDYDPINFRIQPGLISQSLNLTGLLYWRIDRWYGDPWSNVNNAGAFGPGNYPGEGLLVYPGQRAGVNGILSSIRLKQIREGIEDYEYVELLKKQHRGSWALQVARSAGADWSRWSRNPATLQTARQLLGEELHRMAAPAP